MAQLHSIAARVDKRLHRALREVDGCSLSDEGLAYLLRAAHLTVEARMHGRNVVAAHFADPPVELLSQNARVFVSLEVGDKLRGCRARSGRHLLDTVIKSTLYTLQDPRFGGPFTQEDLAHLEVDLLFMLEPEPVTARTLDELEKQIWLGVHGLKIKRGKKTASYKSTVPVEKGWSVQRTLTRLCEKADLSGGTWKSERTEITRYQTVHGREQRQHRFLPGRAVRLLRGLPVVEQAAVDRAAIEQAVVLGCDFTARMIDADGRLAYTYDAVRHRAEYSDERSAVLRGLAATWALAEAGRRMGVGRWLDAARRHISWVLDHHYVRRQGHGLLRVGPKRELNIGSTAFALLVLSALDEPSFQRKRREGLTRSLLALEHTDGFVAATWPPETSDPTSTKQLFYSGEVLTALAAEHRRGRCEAFPEVGERVFDFYRELFATSERRTAMCAWLSKPYGYLFELTNNPRYSGFVLEMGELLVGMQHGVDTDPVDRIGSWTDKGYSFTTGVYMESIAKASQVARRARDRRLERYDTSLFLGSRYLLQCQVGPELVHGDKSSRALGAFLSHTSSRSVRIDNQQHCLWALMEVLDTLDLRYR